MRITDAYHWLLVPVQRDPGRPVSLEAHKADGSKDWLAERASEKLRQSDLLRIVHDARNIRYDLDSELASVWQHGHIAVGALWEYYCRYPYLHRLRDRDVLEEGIRAVDGLLTWEVEAFALATGYDEGTDRYLGLTIPHQDVIGQITDRTLLVRPDTAVAQRQAETAERAAASTGGKGAVIPEAAGIAADQPSRPSDQLPSAAGASEPSEAAGAKNTRFFGVAIVSPERYARDLNRLSQEIIQHLAATEGVELEIRVEISARKPDGFPEDKVRNVAENARTLKFETYGFEDQ